MPKVKRLRELLSYDPLTGDVRWNAGVRTHKSVGKIAGVPCKNGLRVGIDYQNYNMARVIWMWMTGEDPGEWVVDHINGNPLDNQWWNLRLANMSQNNWNQRLKAANKSGIKGVCWCKERDKWLAQITYLGKVIYLGGHVRIEDAKLAVVDARNRLHGEFANHG